MRMEVLIFNKYEVAGKELTASEALSWIKGCEMALIELERRYIDGEITQDNYETGKEYVIEILDNARQIEEALVNELARDYLAKQQDDWDRPIVDIIDEWTAEQYEDKPDCLIL